MASKFYPPPKNEEADDIFSEVISGMFSAFNNPANLKTKKEEDADRESGTTVGTNLEFPADNASIVNEKSDRESLEVNKNVGESSDPPSNVFYPTANNNEIEDLNFNETFLQEITSSNSLPPATPINMPILIKPIVKLDDVSKKKETPKKKLKKKTKGEKSPGSDAIVRLVSLDGQKASTSKIKVEPEMENKPRIVLTFRSEKTGSKNVKIVSQDDRAKEKLMDGKRRSTRSKNCVSFAEPPTTDTRRERLSKRKLLDDVSKKNSKNAGTESDDSSKMQPKKIKKPVANTSDGEESPKETQNQKETVKRSTRFKAKDTDNVVASAIARKEFCNDTLSGLPSRLSRRIKPTEKVLANRILRKGFESQNNARLALISESTVQVQEDAKVLRPRLKKFEDKSEIKKGKMKRRMNLISYKKLSKRKNIPDEMSTTDVNNCILGSDSNSNIGKSNSKGKLSSTKKKKSRTNEEEVTDEETQERHLNRLKKKHLQKLGLQAISMPADNIKEEILSDESTMDSVMTEAIVEHLNTRNMIAEENSTFNTNIKEDIEEDIQIPTANVPQECDLEGEKEFSFSCPEKPKSPTLPRQRRGSRIMYNMFDLSDTEDEENDDDDDYNEIVVPRVTRKRSGMQTSKSNNETPEKINRDEIGSPVTADKRSKSPSQPIGSSTDAMSCLCTSKTNIYFDPDAIETEFCRAIDWVGNRAIGCGRVADQSLSLVRASVRCPYILACEMHRARMSLHHCCAGCGLFCTQGIFYRCNEGHLFHGECGLPLTVFRFPFNQSELESSAKPGCPHCGENSTNHLPINTQCRKVNLQMKCKKPVILLPRPRKQWELAFMSFSNKNVTADILQSTYNSEMPILPAQLLVMLRVETENLQSDKDNVDYDVLLMKVNQKQPEKEDIDLITAVCNKDETVAQIIDALLAGGNPKKPVADSDGGNCLHLAAREFNLSALHLFKMLNCELDVFDSKQRTPLMLAFISYDNKMKELEKSDADADCNKDETAVATKQKEKTVNEKQKEVYKKKFLSVIQYLVKAGADITLKGPEGVTVLHLAAKISDVAATSILLQNNIHVSRSFINEKDDGGWTALVWAAENKNTQIVRYLLEMGADPMISDSENNVALHWAVLTGCSDSIELLLNAGSHVNVVNTHGETPLHVAARQNHYNGLVILLARGAKINLKNNNEETAFDCVAEENSNCYSALTLNLQLQTISNSLEKTERIVSNDISNGKEMYPIQCVNEIDDEDVIGEFCYITENCLTTDLNIDRKITSMDLCQCSGRCDQSVFNCSCSNLGIKCWYDCNRKLVSNFDYYEPPMIFECNFACSCNVNQCLNRCVGMGPKVSLQVFRLGGEGARGSGWGVKTLQHLPKGTFVAEYTGELLTTNDAYKKDDDSYLFLLEVKDEILEDSTTYCIDAKNYGNISRFINHKCDPNLIPVRVFVHHRDLRFPRIAFFTLKDIAVGEELGFDYGEKFWSIKSKIISCNCSSIHCRYGNANEEMEITENGNTNLDDKEEDEDD